MAIDGHDLIRAACFKLAEFAAGCFEETIISRISLQGRYWRQ